MIINLLALLANDIQVVVALSSILLDVALLLTLTYGLLYLLGYVSRFNQTLIALSGTEIVIKLLALPILIWLTIGEKTYANPLSYIILMLAVWQVAIVAHVLRHALSTSQEIGVVYALAYFIISYVMTSFLIPSIS